MLAAWMPAIRTNLHLALRTEAVVVVLEGRCPGEEDLHLEGGVVPDRDSEHAGWKAQTSMLSCLNRVVVDISL